MTPYPIAVACLLALGPMVSISQSAVDDSRATSRQDVIEKKLDTILTRLEALEKRVEYLENPLKRPSPADGTPRYLFGEDGILRTRDGRPVGYWGIDVPQRAAFPSIPVR